MNQPDGLGAAPHNPARKMRLDLLLVERGEFESRERARRAIMAGTVLVDEVVIDKPGTNIAPDRTIRVRHAERYVSRGGTKLEGALEAFAVNPKGKLCLDVGASTGGFTDCLLQRGARKVIAVDVGHNQMHHRIRSDARVVCHEKINARALPADLFDEPPVLFVADVSFISLTLILPSVRQVIAPDAEGIILIKPQFELAKEQVGKGGIVRDPALHQAAVDKIQQAALQGGWLWKGTIPSPILGTEGNHEFLAHILKQPEN